MNLASASIETCTCAMKVDIRMFSSASLISVHTSFLSIVWYFRSIRIRNDNYKLTVWFGQLPEKTKAALWHSVVRRKAEQSQKQALNWYWQMYHDSLQLTKLSTSTLNFSSYRWSRKYEWTASEYCLKEYVKVAVPYGLLSDTEHFTWSSFPLT